MRVPCWRGVRSIPKRMIAREPTIVRVSLVDEDEPTRRRRVPRVRRNHVQRGSQLFFKRLIHTVDLFPDLYTISPLAKFRHDGGVEISVNSTSYDGLAIATPIWHQDSC